MHATDTRSRPGPGQPPPPPYGRVRVGPGDARRTDRALAAGRRIGYVARLLDDLVPIPGTRSRIGLDPLIGLIPFVGDAMAGIMGAWIVLESARFGVPPIVLVRMLLNTTVDFLIGLVPFLGDVVDIGFKGNRRNLELFHRHALDPEADTSGSIALVAGVLLVIVGIAWLLISLIGNLLSTVVG
jgi:hypothetical protein